MFSVFDYVHYCMQNAEENKLKFKLKHNYMPSTCWMILQRLLQHYMTKPHQVIPLQSRPREKRFISAQLRLDEVGHTRHLYQSRCMYVPSDTYSGKHTETKTYRRT